MEDENILEFREGKRVVPDHLVNELKQLETYRMTYADALKEADKKRAERWLSDLQHKVIYDHISEVRRGY